MIIFPAIDIKEGKVVRLKQGRFDEVTEYADDPVAVAQKWVKQGAQWLHVVDLDGAQKGKITNWDSLERVAQSVKIPIQMGGGVRSEEDIARLLSIGISRIVLGTKVIEDRAFLTDILTKWPHQIAVSLDCADGMLTLKGWTKVTTIKATDFAKDLEGTGLQYLIYTDVKRDGMLTGPNFESLEKILDRVDIPVIASGGISHLNDIRQLCRLKPKGLMGAITGKALYEEKFDLKSALEICSQNV